MALIALTEQQIINNAYYLTEKASELWTSTSDEYLTARGLANIAIGRWKLYEQTKWDELLTTLAASSDGVKTTTSGVYTYACPTNALYPAASFVKTGNTIWHVIDSKGRLLYDSTLAVCWFTGNSKLGFTLNFNPGTNLTTGDTIDYDYYRDPTLFTTTTSTTELSDPYFISYYIAAHMAEDGIDPDLNNMAEARLEQMRVQNLSSLYGVPDDIISTTPGFG